MKWDVRSIFTGAASRMSIEDSLDFSQVDFHGSRFFPSPVTVSGEVANAGDIVTLRATVHYKKEGLCDRCLAPTVQEGAFAIEHVLVTSTENDSDDFIVLDRFMLDLDDVVQDDLWMELPTKNLCREDCRGICPSCGQNLNEGQCSCSGKECDPRLAALADWMK